MKKLSDVSIITLVVGIILLAIGVWLSYLTIDHYNVHGNTVTGEVTSVTTIVRGHSGRSFSLTSYCPVIKFITLDNQQVEHSSSVCANKHTFEVGQVVDVIYDSRDPKIVAVKNTLLIWTSQIWLLAWGIFLTWMGARNKV